MRSGIVRVVVLLLLSVLGFAQSRAADDFLEPEKAFRVSSRAADDKTIEVAFDIAPGYYMYREPFAFRAERATLQPAVIPPGHVKFDDTFQKDVETYRDTVVIRIPVSQAEASFDLSVTSQGCADKGLCYPPQTSTLRAKLAGYGGDGTVMVVSTGDLPPAAARSAAAGKLTPAVNTESPTDSAGIDAALKSGRFWSVIGVFAAAGLLLSFTPCVLPMLPILASIIVGQDGGATRGRGLLLAGSYSLGMALVYTALGIAAGLAGEGLAAALQTPWVLGLFALMLATLALSMFGVYELQLPAAWRDRVNAASNRLPGGRVLGVFAMGGVSALIVSPCIAAPLAGALVYLSQTRDVMLGGSALFALAAGMSVPLLLVGASAGSLLPRAGAWMDGVKRGFGVLLLGVALWIVQPVLPRTVSLLLWGALALGTAVWLFGYGSTQRRLLQRGAAAFLGALGLMQLIGAATGGADPLRPLAHLVSRAESPGLLTFTRIRTVAELDAALASAGPTVMLDFYADWCVSCKEMEHFTFSEPEVRERLSKARLLQVDVTQNNADDRALMRRFGLFGPPGTLFFDASGRETASLRVIGYQDAARFKQTLQAAGL